MHGDLEEHFVAGELRREGELLFPSLAGLFLSRKIPWAGRPGKVPLDRGRVQAHQKRLDGVIVAF
jgi:hypothetical protein